MFLVPRSDYLLQIFRSFLDLGIKYLRVNFAVSMDIIFNDEGSKS